MGDADNYAPGTYNDPYAPWNREDPTDTQAFEDKAAELLRERIADTYGYQQEAYTEAPDDARRWLTQALLDGNELLVGKLFLSIIQTGCKAPDDEIIEALNEEPGDY